MSGQYIKIGFVSSPETLRTEPPWAICRPEGVRSDRSGGAAVAASWWVRVCKTGFCRDLAKRFKRVVGHLHDVGVSFHLILLKTKTKTRG